MGRSRLLLVALVAAAMAGGCGGDKKKKTKTAAGEDGVVGMEPGGPGSYGVPDLGEGGDLSTGDAVPTGPGEATPDEHVMTADAKGIYNDGVEAAASGNLTQAEAAFKRVLQIDPRAHQAAYNLGVCADRTGNDNAARNYYRQALSLQPNYLPAIAALSNLEIRTGNIDAGVGLLKGKAGAYPQDIGILNTYAGTLIVARRYSDAIDVAKQALRIDERNAEAMLMIGKANLRLGRNELALSVFEQVLAIDPNVAEVYFLRSFVSLEEDQKAKAIEELKSTLERDPEHVEAMNNLATQYHLSGNYQAAVDQLEKAVQLAPSWGVLHLNYGNALRGVGRWQEAKVSLERARALDSTLKSSIFNMGVLYYVADQLDNLDRLARLGEAKRLFAQYKSEMGSALSKDHLVHKYLKEVQVAVEREERRIQQEKEYAELEAKRAAEREAAAAAAAAGGGADAGAADEGWEDEDEGWE
jgi:superkiller protein 3